MLRRFASWLRLMRLTRARRMADDWRGNADAVSRRMSRDGRRLESMMRKFDDLSATIKDDLDDADALHKSQASVVEALQTENRLLAEVQVPQLVAMHQLVLKRLDAETAMQVRREEGPLKEREE